MINLNSIKMVKNDHENYIQEVTPMINNQIESISDNEALNNSDIQIKVAFLEKYSSLSEDEQANINLNEFVEDLQAEYEQLADQFNDYSQNQEENDERQEIASESATKAKEIVSGLFDVLYSLAREQSASHDRSKKDHAQVFRKRGTDGREL